ncbi:MAG: amidohydrolase [Streptococcaceae bacterium]|jgi:hippurate hydrolase|nr:amidohydrolase [Streptococcaceae bacterium]
MIELLEKYRTDLHQIPELGFKEFKTKDYIMEQIKGYDCEINEVGETGLVLYFGNEQKKTIAFRTDIDALPIIEENDIWYKSKHKGRMHACGHDGHMAMMLVFCKYLNENKSKLDKNVCIIFQPSEENRAGAHTILKSGLWEKYRSEAIFGMHLWPGLSAGEVFSKPNEMMSQGSETNITIHGKSAHIASYQKGIDALEIACRYLLDVYKFERSISPTIDRLVRFGVMNSGTARNIVSDKTELLGTIRTFSNSAHKSIKYGIHQIADRYEEQYGVKFDFKYYDGYETVINDEELFNRLQPKLQVNILEKPVMQSEDFSVYRHHEKEIFFFLGVGDVPNLHNPHFNFDMKILQKGVEFWQKLLWAY